MLQLLGEGGMGRVLLVEHVLMQTRHAIKVLHDQLSSNAQIVQRFLNEARAAGAIGHRNVVEITHVDQVEGGGAWYLVMKYLEGHTLAGFLASRGTPIEQRLIVHIIGEALNGLQAAHDRRIIHRDLKPDNLYLTSVKDDPFRTIILDFGVAQLGQEAGVITRTGALIGTPQYMAPEQHRSAPIDHRTDIWAMGAIVYEMATGRLPYQRDDAERGYLTGPEIFHRMMTYPIVDPRRYNPAITEGFARATLIALAPDPARRPDSARTLAVMLAEATPGTSHAPSGIDVLKTHADELLEASAWHQVPATAPVPQGTGGQRRIAAQPPAASTPMSTLGASASQSFAVAQAPGASRRRRPSLLAVAGGIVAMAVTSAVVLSRSDPPDMAMRRRQASALHDDAGTAAAAPHAAVVAAANGDATRASVPADVDTKVAKLATPGVASPNAAPLNAVTPKPAPPNAVTPGAATPMPATSKATPPNAVTSGAVTPEAVTPKAAPPEAVTPGAVTPKAAPPGAVTPEAVTPNAAPPNAVTPKAAPPKAVTPGAVTPGAVTPKAVSPNAVTSGAAPPGAAPPGAAPPPKAVSPNAATLGARNQPASTASTADARQDAAPGAAARGSDPHDAGLRDATPPRRSDPSNASPKVVRPEPVATGKLNVIILPWAEVWVDGRPLGQTPVTAKLSAGPHRVRLRNDATEKTITVTVTGGKTTVIDQTW